MYENIIFLDVDGVLNSLPFCNSRKPSDIDINAENLKWLSELYHTSHAKIVLSSTWKELAYCSDPFCHRMYQELENSLKKYGMYIFSQTPCVNGNRPAEIKAWLNTYQSNSKICFVSLDDDFHEEDYEKVGIGGHLVQTKYFCNSLEEGGLQQQHVAQALNILAKQKEAAI